MCDILGPKSDGRLSTKRRGMDRHVDATPVDANSDGEIGATFVKVRSILIAPISFS